MSRWSDIQQYEHETGFTHPDHDIELRRHERRRTTVTLIFGVIAPLLIILLVDLANAGH